ncbi:MAG TPA: hypothetical protein VGY57_04070 [Vicinamibacterales bacterium]|nr:hypothetical protein [Vicinamibacterales bacterium]
MDKRRRRKHKGQKRSLVLCNQHRPFFDSTPGGGKKVTTLETAVDTQAARFKDQERATADSQTAADHNEASRKTLHNLIRHVEIVSKVMPADSGTPAFDTSSRTSDEQLIARTEAVLDAAAQHTDPFVNEGVLPGLHDRLSSELAAFKKSKDAVTASVHQYTEATAGLDQALGEGDDALDVIESILVASPDGPVGVLTALRQARLIGPRDAQGEPANGQPAQPASPAGATPTTATTPATATTATTPSTLTTTTPTTAPETIPAPPPTSDKAA